MWPGHFHTMNKHGNERNDLVYCLLILYLTKPVTMHFTCTLFRAHSSLSVV